MWYTISNGSAHFPKLTSRLSSRWRLEDSAYSWAVVKAVRSSMVVDVRMALPSLDFDFLVAGIVKYYCFKSVSDNVSSNFESEFWAEWRRSSHFAQIFMISFGLRNWTYTSFVAVGRAKNRLFSQHIQLHLRTIVNKVQSVCNY